jgi:prolipoprotein diacylglyceryl transferase
MTLLSRIPELLPAEIPSPTEGVWRLGPIPIRGYAMAILAGIVVAVWLTQRRLAAQGERPGVALDISAWAVPFGILGGRIYHVITTPQPYFGENGRPLDAFKIWEGGLGIWGAIALGALGAWIGCRQSGVSFLRFIDAAAPGVAIAQAMGRVGNWFNNEIYGKPTDVPWKLKVYEWDTTLGRAVVDANGDPVVKGYFHPTFLYEALWCLALAAVLIWIGHRWTLRPGQTFAAYVMGYPIGRIVIENMRTDAANHILGQRVNTWVSILVFLLGLWLWWKLGRRPLPPEPAGPSVTVEGAEPSEASEPSKPSEPAAGERMEAGDGDEPKTPEPAAATEPDRPAGRSRTTGDPDRTTD